MLGFQRVGHRGRRETGAKAPRFLWERGPQGPLFHESSFFHESSAESAPHNRKAAQSRGHTIVRPQNREATESQGRRILTR